MFKKDITDKELIEYILGSLRVANDYIRSYNNEEEFNFDLKTQDAACYRMSEIGVATEHISDKVKEKYHDFPWFLYEQWKIFQDIEAIWELGNHNMKENGDFDSFFDLYDQLQIILNQEFFPNKELKKKNSHEKEWTTEFSYPITTRSSVWTIKNK